MHEKNNLMTRKLYFQDVVVRSFCSSKDNLELEPKFTAEYKRDRL